MSKVLSTVDARYTPGSTDIMNAETNTSSGLADHSAVLQSVIDTLDGVVLHAHQETRTELRMRSTGVEESG